MTILSSLEYIRENMSEMSLGDVIRGTRDVLGMKQWAMCQYLGISTARLKILESDLYRALPEEELVKKFCELFEYEFQDVWNSAQMRVEIHQKRMTIAKSPAYEKKLCALDSTKNQ